MSKRKSVYAKNFRHSNPIPNASRIGNLLISGLINGVDPATGKVAATLEAQCAHMFAHMRETVEAGGGTADDIIAINVWMMDRAQRQAVNREWLKMFPDEASRPARRTMKADLEGGILVQCDFTAVIDTPSR